MKTVRWLLVLMCLAPPAQAHRTEGLLQASLVEILPHQVGVEITLIPGIDISPQVVALLDSDHDGVCSAAESTSWTASFMAAQSVLADGQQLPLRLISTSASPLADMAGGHAQIKVHFTAALPALMTGPCQISCINGYQPMPSSYQTNGIVPQTPGLRITSHRQTEPPTRLDLQAEFPPVSSQAPTAAPSAMPRLLVWTAALAVAGCFYHFMQQRRRCI